MLQADFVSNTFASSFLFGYSHLNALCTSGISVPLCHQVSASASSIEIMELPKIVEFAGNFSVMVRINGPDPKGLKMRNHAFHQYHSGKTTLSASGLLLPRNLRKSVDCDCGHGAVVITVASIVEPFLSQKSQMISAQGMPELIPGTQIDVMVEVKSGIEQGPLLLDDGRSKCFIAQVLRLVDVPASSSAIQSLVEASSGSSEHGWEVGWSLAARSPHTDNSQKFTDSERQAKSDVGLNVVNVIGKPAARLAFLLIPSLLEDLPEVKTSYTNKRGDFLLSMGSPFGVLSPLHFFNSISVGSVANCYPSVSSDHTLLMADIRCLPGMEGGPVFGQHACLVGILNQPLRQTGGAEIQVVIPWSAIESAVPDFFQSDNWEAEKEKQYVGNFSESKTAELKSSNFIDNHLVSCSTAPLVVEQAMNSVCLISLDNGVWASGVLLNKDGLILTNAHLLEPWRFRRTTIQGGHDKTRKNDIFTLLEESMPLGLAGEQKSPLMQPNVSDALDYSSKNRDFHVTNQVKSQIRVRVGLVNSWVWCNAKVVYVSKGPLDISLLHLEFVPHQLCPIAVDLASPSLGSRAFVIGHGLFGPRCDLSPSVSSGVVSKVVKAKMGMPRLALPKCQSGEVPVMLETTASVHPGGSGGAVVDSSGHMIALVTSNAKHGGGTVIPHMNFSIAAGALEPLFEFAKDMQDITLLQQLDRPNTELASVWAMMPKIPPKTDPLLPGMNDLLRNDKEKHGKGSQFTKFINERRGLLTKPRDLETIQELARNSILSKL